MFGCFLRGPISQPPNILCVPIDTTASATPGLENNLQLRVAFDKSKLRLNSEKKTSLEHCRCHKQGGYCNLIFAEHVKGIQRNRTWKSSTVPLRKIHTAKLMGSSISKDIVEGYSEGFEDGLASFDARKV